MLVVETIAKICGAYFSLGKPIKEICRNCTYRARLCGRSFARTPPSSITNVRANRFPGLGLGDSGRVGERVRPDRDPFPAQADALRELHVDHRHDADGLPVKAMAAKGSRLAG